MKKTTLFLASLLVCSMSFGKAVNEQSAKLIGYNYLKTEGVQVDQSAMSLVYKTTATIKNTGVTDFYVFNTGEKGFVIVSGDDNVTPVLAYSVDDIFRAENIPAQINDWLNNYKSQIDYVIEHNIQASEQTAIQWANLQSPVMKSAAKTTSVTSVSSFMTTKWDQAGYYNKLCPFDATQDTNALTGCVATAMAQVMRYWKWPATGLGTHSYLSTYGSLFANFGATTYTWDSMPNLLYRSNSFVATLMSQAGISVDMHYGVTASGAFVTEFSAPPSYNSAEYALKTYFKYKASTMQGLSRYSYSDAAWLKLIKDDITAKRPVIYTGAGPDGGHCFIADGYTSDDKIHFNWGWGGYCNGYFLLSNLAPTTTSTFNDQQTIIIGITPDNPIALGVNETVPGAVSVVYPNPAKDVLHVDMKGANITGISLSDMQGRTFKTVTPAKNTLVTIPVSDLSAGIYIIAVQTETGVTTNKVVIE